MQTTHILWWVPGKSALLTRSFLTLRLRLRVTQLNPLKTRELIFHRRGVGASVDPAHILLGAINVQPLIDTINLSLLPSRNTTLHSFTPALPTLDTSGEQSTLFFIAN